MNPSEKRARLLADAEAHQKAAYYLIDHVARSDDKYLAEAAMKLAKALQKRALDFKQKEDQL